MPPPRFDAARDRRVSVLMGARVPLNQKRTDDREPTRAAVDGEDDSDRGAAIIDVKRWRLAKERVNRLGRLGPFAVAVVVLPALSGLILLGWMDPVGQWLRGHESVGVLLFVLATVVFGSLGVLPTAMLCLVAGYAFGFGVGAGSALLGILGATVLGYGFARLISGNRLIEAIADMPRAAALHAAFVGASFTKSALVVTLVRISPLFPFAATNLLLAASRVRLSVFVTGTALGLVPRSVGLAFAGSEAASLVEEPDDPWMRVYAIVASLVALVLLGFIARRVLKGMAVVGRA